jgi:hypothetical protein
VFESEGFGVLDLRVLGFGYSRVLGFEFKGFGLFVFDGFRTCACRCYE